MDIHSCIKRVTPPECPLCRTPYVQGKWLKLHVDMSALCHNGAEKEARRLPVDASAPYHTGAEKEARRLQEAIGEVTTSGSSEGNLRQLINECRNFLHAQPRSMVRSITPLSLRA